MEISIFDVTGPVMVGPSSSHTAGAARLARVAAMIAEKPFCRVSFGLHGSFAKTYKGHGTDRALVAGALGLREDDERLADAFSLARERGLAYDFHEIELDGVHENSVRMTFYFSGGEVCEVAGSSIGGGRIVIRRINGFDVEFTARSSTLIIRQMDRRGLVSEVSKIVADSGLNIGVMRLSRRGRGDTACCILEVDGDIPEEVVRRIRQVEGIESVQAVNLGREV